MERVEIEELFYGPLPMQRRFTQDFPVLPDVWMEYGERPKDRIALLLTPNNQSSASVLAQALRKRLKDDPELDEPVKGRVESQRRSVLFNESVVLANLSFRELLRAALPLTDWWKRVVAPLGDSWLATVLSLKTPNPSDRGGPHREANLNASARRVLDPYLLQKLVQIVGRIASEPAGRRRPQERRLPRKPPSSTVVANAFERIFEKLPAVDSPGVLWGVSLNRKADTSVWRSRLTVKADAASRVFEANTSGIRWAVLDTGIDARHPGFRRRDGDGNQIEPVPNDLEDGIRSRVVRTYDFLKLKTLLDPDVPPDLTGTAAAALSAEDRERLSNELDYHLARGRAVDWDLLEPFLRVPHSPELYQRPKCDGHGTHVAGILAANWREAKDDTPLKVELRGVCPDLELYDLRVLPDEQGEKADEFTIIAALQFVRHLNAHKDVMVIHGVNLSLAMTHDVANYACGRTPVCEECERVVGTGVVVVAAAGNRGFNKLQQSDAGASGDYRYISITDPGNADSVITVGSTHRMLPHTYGVSYFSSRGPTGDGRTKPDLVAPGERIDSCALDDYFATFDGTSQATPHVSGAAAILMSRHRELMGSPRRVKEILCKSATDLGREPRFQGAGMVDVLRALQSV